MAHGSTQTIASASLLEYLFFIAAPWPQTIRQVARLASVWVDLTCSRLTFPRQSDTTSHAMLSPTAQLTPKPCWSSRTTVWPSAIVPDALLVKVPLKNHLRSRRISFSMCRS